MRLSTILAILSLSSPISALAAPKSLSQDGGLELFGKEKDCQCSAMGAVCHKVSHINCCNGLSCEMVDNPNGDYGICRATNSDRDKDEQCMCSMSGDMCNPMMKMNCCFGLFCDMNGKSHGEHGMCKPSNESKTKNPLKKVDGNDDDEQCAKPGTLHCNLLGAKKCCPRSQCMKLLGSENTFACMEGYDDDDDDKKQCLKIGSMKCNLRGAKKCCPGSECKPLIGSEDNAHACMKSYEEDKDEDRQCMKPGSLHCDYDGASECCPGSMCKKLLNNKDDVHACIRDFDVGEEKQCLVPGAYHCNIPGMDCCPGASCKNMRGESFMCAKDSDDDDDLTTLFKNQQPLISLKDKNVFEEDCDRNMCIEGGQMCHRHHRQSSKCPTSPCCPDFECAHMKGRRESFCISKSNSLEKVQQKPRMSKKKNELTTENCAPQPPNNCSPYGCPCDRESDNCCAGQYCTGMSSTGRTYCVAPDDQEDEKSPLYTLKGMFQGFVEKIEEKFCLPQGESCMMHHDKCCPGSMCNNGHCRGFDNDELKL